MLYLNYFPKILDKVEKFIVQMPEANIARKVRNNIQSIEMFHCSLDNIYPMGKFKNLTDLNIGDNLEIKSLKGIEGCQKLKYLNCHGCDLLHID